MKILISIILIFISTTTICQSDSLLSREIDSLVKVDQKWRGLYRQVLNEEIDTISSSFVSFQIRIVDSLNFISIQTIFNKHGYPGYDKVGKESSHNFWLLVQHADNHASFQDSVLTKMKIEAEKGNSSLNDYAYLVDRVKVNTGQLQIYGTQMHLNQDKSSYESKPVIEPDKLNERRKEVGLGTIEDYIEIMNNRYFGTLKK